jgi:ATP-dependent Clp protease ATP-binding subunit ClpA
LLITIADIAIKYEELTVDQQITIFNSFLDQLIAKGLVDKPQDLKNWVNKDGKKMAFNGRQIRNVISTAMGIALIDDINGNKLCREHLVKVADQTREFKRDLRSQEELHKNLFK